MTDMTTTRYLTFRDLFNFIQIAKTDEVGFYRTGNVNLQIYDTHDYKTQVNVNFCDDPTDTDGLSYCNFVFRVVDDKPVSVTVYPCTRPGLCNYAGGSTYDIDCNVDGPNAVYWNVSTYEGGRVKEALRDILNKQ